VEQLVSQLAGAVREGVLRATDDIERQASGRFRVANHASPQREAGTRKRRKLDMACRIAGCRNRSKGPRFRFMCETHARLPKGKQIAAVEAWKANSA